MQCPNKNKCTDLCLRVCVCACMHTSFISSISALWPPDSRVGQVWAVLVERVPSVVLLAYLCKVVHTHATQLLCDGSLTLRQTDRHTILHHQKNSSWDFSWTNNTKSNTLMKRTTGNNFKLISSTSTDNKSLGFPNKYLMAVLCKSQEEKINLSIVLLRVQYVIQRAHSCLRTTQESVFCLSTDLLDAAWRPH